MRIGRKILIIYVVMTFLTAGCAMHPEYANYERASWHSDQAVRRLQAVDQIMSSQQQQQFVPMQTFQRR